VHHAMWRPTTGTWHIKGPGYGPWGSGGEITVR
jgi:hypothetical protein